MVVRRLTPTPAGSAHDERLFPVDTNRRTDDRDALANDLTPEVPLVFGIELTPEHSIDRLTDLGTAAEAAGYDAIFVSSHYNNRSPFAVLSRLAAETETVRLGPGVVNPLERHPVTLAGEVATVAEASDGRAVFGVGPGDPSTLGNLGLADERGLRPVLEAFKIAQRLWDGERVTHDGTFTAEDAGLNFGVQIGRAHV